MNPKKKYFQAKHKSEQGFSVVELLMVAFIMAIGLLGLLALQVTSIASGSQSRMRGTATLLAHNLLDRVVAEGLVSSAERYDSGNGTIQAPPVSTTRWTYIDPDTLTAKAATVDSYCDILGDSVSSSNPSRVYTVSYQRMAGVKGSNVLAMQPFVVNVQWLEAVKNSSGTWTTQSHFFSVSRNVRI